MYFKERTSHFQTTDIDPHSGGLLAEPRNVRGKVKAILRDSFCGFLKARIMLLALSSSIGYAWVPLTGE